MHWKFTLLDVEFNLNYPFSVYAGLFVLYG